MIDGKTILAVIPARGGSKGLPKKNLRNLGGRPLIAHSVEQARASRLIDRVICSTDDSEIAEAALLHGCEVPFMRPSELARDDTETIEVICHLCERIDRFDYLVLLQPTSPLRSVEDIDTTVGRCHGSGAPSAVTVCKADKHPLWMFTLGQEGAMHPILDAGAMKTRRQDLPSAYALNGAVYVIRWESIEARQPLIGPGTVAHVMPKERSIDIDCALDLKFANFLLEIR